MAHLHGKDGDVKSGATSLLGIDTWTVDTEADVLEVTDFQSAGKKEFIPGNTGWSGTFEGNIDNTQDITASPPDLVAGKIVALELILDSAMKLTGDAIVQTVSITTPQADKIRYTVTFQGTGTLTQDLATP